MSGDVIRNQCYQSILNKKIFGDRTGFLTAKDAQMPMLEAMHGRVCFDRMKKKKLKLFERNFTIC